MRELVGLAALITGLCAFTCISLAQETPREPAPDQELSARIEQLLKRLGDDDFQKREVAQKELIEIGKPALEAMERTAASADDAEVKTRAKAIVQEIRKSIFTLMGKNEQGLEEYRHETSGMIFVKVPGGTFKMGSESGSDDAKPVHDVKVGAFLISKYEVTQAVWVAIMGNNPSTYRGDERPVEKVAWDDCQQFCKKTGLRLPTEAEWEYACRAGSTTEYYWGDKPDGECMWYAENAAGQTHAVGKKKPNAFGLFDMSGNVWEWCQDWYADNYYAESPADNPTGPEDGKLRVGRGGCMRSVPEEGKSAGRFGHDPTGAG
jgi:formylglycine-generating enzyme required for sulfatase activity